MSRWSRFVLLVLLLPCCGSSCEEAVPPALPPPDALKVPHLKTEEGTLRMRVRASRPELSVDCNTTILPVGVGDEVFGPWRELALTTEPTPVFRPEDRGLGAEEKCALLAFELPTGPVVHRTTTGYQDFYVNRDSTGALTVSGGLLVAQPKGDSPTCTQQKLMSWSDSTLTGAAVVQAVKTGEDGCQTLELRVEGADAGPSFTWSACLGAAKMPFSANEPVRITNNENQTTHARVLRIERTAGERLVMWLLRGPPGGFAAAGFDATVAGISSNQRGEDCRMTVDPRCRTLQLGEDVNVTITPRSLVLKAGEGANVVATNGTRLELQIVHSLLRPVVDPSCSRDLEATLVDVGVVLVERGGPNKKVPEIAR
jgi:hypothetical protein